MPALKKSTCACTCARCRCLDALPLPCTILTLTQPVSKALRTVHTVLYRAFCTALNCTVPSSFGSSTDCCHPPLVAPMALPGQPETHTPMARMKRSPEARRVQCLRPRRQSMMHAPRVAEPVAPRPRNCLVCESAAPTLDARRFWDRWTQNRFYNRWTQAPMVVRCPHCRCLDALRAATAAASPSSAPAQFFVLCCAVGWGYVLSACLHRPPATPPC